MPFLHRRVCYTWSKCPILWNNADWTWSECQLVREVLGKLADKPQWLEEPWNPYPKNSEKQAKLIKLMCKVKGEEYNDELNKKDFKITINEVKLLVKKVFDIDIIVEVIDNKR